MNIEMKPVAYVKNEVFNKKDISWKNDISKIVLEEKYSGGLKGLEQFSHAIIVFYLDKANFTLEKHLQRKPKGREDMPLVGIFSQRTKDRPNKIGVTTVEIISVDDDVLVVSGLDAIDNTPILDIKPYYKQFDYRENVTTPQWVNDLMKDYF